MPIAVRTTPPLIAIVGCISWWGSLAAQASTPPDAFARYEKAAKVVQVADSAYHAKSYALAATTYVRVADDWIHPGDLHYNAACSLALSNHPEEAEAELKRAIATGYQDALQLESDPDLVSLHGRAAWPAIVRSIKRAVADFRRNHGDPARARLVTSDIPRFWHAFDLAQQPKTPAERAAVYRSEYFSGGSVGLADYFLVKIRSVDGFTAFVDRTSKYYASIRGSTLKVANDVTGIRAVFRKMKDLYADAVFPDVYFVIGRLSSGGTSTQTGLLLGAEMFSATPSSPRDEITNRSTRDFISNAELIPTIVAHELVHFEQNQSGSPTLLRQVLIEGGADFIAKLITGVETDTASMRFGREHEAMVWQRFLRDKDSTDAGYWIANGGSSRVGADWMHDMGYFVGFQIASAYYDKAHDKKQAVRDLLALKDPDALLTASGYGAGVKL